MKKYFKIIPCVLLILLMIVPNLAYAKDSYTIEWQNVQLNEAEFNEVLANNPTVSPRATGLIVARSIAMSNNGNTLFIAGQTLGTTEVVKCGFTKVTIQRRANSSSSWSNYAKYDDLYSDSNSYRLSKSISVPGGYQYRVTCTHYAKKNLLSTQKIDNVSNIISV